MGCLSAHPAFACAAVLGVAALLLASSGASAFAQSLNVVVVTDRPGYQVGDFVNATVYVLDGGALTDADAVSLTVSPLGQGSPTENVSLSHVTTGTYRGTFEVTSNLTSTPFNPGLTLRALATVGSMTDAETTSISTPPQPDFRAHLALSRTTALPGQVVDGTLTVTYNGLPYDASDANVSVHLDVAPFSWPVYPSLTNLSTGVYGFSYTVPPSLDSPAEILFVSSATMIQGNHSFSWGEMASVLVTLPDPFDVWYNATSWTSSSTSFDVWVAAPTGVPVTGASVTLYSPEPPTLPPSLPSALHAITDASGRASFEVSNYGRVLLPLSGYVTRGIANQTIGGVLERPPSTNQSFTGLELRRDNVLDVLVPGETAVVNYTALMDGVPLNGTRFYYDVHNATTLLGHGSVVTSPGGAFSLRFPMPSDTATADFSAELASNVWDSAFATVTPAHRLDAQVGAFQVGGETRITAALPATSGTWRVTATFYPDARSAYPDLRPDWSESADLAGLYPGIAAGVANGTGLSVNLTLPSFLPGDRDYYLEVDAQAMNGSAPVGLPYVLKERVYVVGRPPVPADASLVMALVAGIAAVGGAAVVALLLLRRRRPPTVAPPSAPPPGPTGSPPPPDPPQGP